MNQTDPETARLQNVILEREAEIATLRDLLGKENQRANAAIDREETAEQAALEARQELVEVRAAAFREAAEAQQQPNIGARAEEPPTEEQMVRDHVTTLHLIGEQLTRVESWMWAHLADVRDAQAATPAPVAQQAAAEASVESWARALAGARVMGRGGLPFDQLPAAEQEEFREQARRIATEQQAPAADDEETRRG